MVHRGGEMAVKVLTNDPYETCLNYRRLNEKPVIDRWNSFHRFETTADRLEKLRKKAMHVPDRNEAFRILAAADSDQTRWSIVYDNRNMRIYYRTAIDATVREIKADLFDFSCRAPAKMLNIHSKYAGDVTEHFRGYSAKQNTDSVKTSFEKLARRMFVPPKVVDLYASFPEK